MPDVTGLNSHREIYDLAAQFPQGSGPPVSVNGTVIVEVTVKLAIDATSLQSVPVYVIEYSQRVNLCSPMTGDCTSDVIR